MARTWSVLLITSMTGAVLLTRLFLFLYPGVGGSTVLGVHIHHLLIGIVLAVAGGVPAVLIRSERFLKSVAVFVFGFGLGLALDEWVLFVLRENAPDTPYMSPASFAGALFFAVLAGGYVVLVSRLVAKRERDEDSEGESHRRN